MNSMADSLSHECLLCFATDFGIAGSLLSTLEVGEVFLSCDGEYAAGAAGVAHFLLPRPGKYLEML